MKQLEITTNKRLLIVEYDTEAECAVEWALMHAFKNPNIVNHGHKVKPICNGSELTEDIAKGLVHQSLHTNLFAHYVKDIQVNVYCYINSLDSFDTAINAYGYHYWGENPVKKPKGEDYYYEEKHGFDGVETMWDGGSYQEDLEKWQEAESRTFAPEKCIIFEIL